MNPLDLDAINSDSPLDLETAKLLKERVSSELYLIYNDHKKAEYLNDTLVISHPLSSIECVCLNPSTRNSYFLSINGQQFYYGANTYELKYVALIYLKFKKETDSYYSFMKKLYESIKHC